jgi:hypothetical protein
VTESRALTALDGLGNYEEGNGAYDVKPGACLIAMRAMLKCPLSTCETGATVRLHLVMLNKDPFTFHLTSAFQNLACQTWF